MSAVLRGSNRSACIRFQTGNFPGNAETLAGLTEIGMPERGASREPYKLFGERGLFLLVPIA